jgi:hypothetical protein
MKMDRRLDGTFPSLSLWPARREEQHAWSSASGVAVAQFQHQVQHPTNFKEAAAEHYLSAMMCEIVN